MNVLELVADTIRSIAPRAHVDDREISLDEFVRMVTTLGGPFPQYSLPNNTEEAERTFLGFVEGALRASGVVFAVAMTRFLLISQARFQFQQMRGGQPGDLFGTPELGILEKPWPGAVTADLLASLDLDVQFAGNAYALRRPGRVERLRPDWTGIVFGSRSRPDIHPWDPDAEVVGYVFIPGGPNTGEEPMTFLAEEVAHLAPFPDPSSRVRGMSWVTPAITAILGDRAAMRHKLAFFEHGATPNLVVKSSITDTKKWREWVEAFRQAHEGAARAYKTLHLQGGADATVVGANLRQLDFKATQGHGETIIAACSGMHPVVVGLSEGLAGSSLNAGNFRAAVRAVADAKLRPLWGEMCGSIETIVPALPGTRLWYDDRHIPFLSEDIKDQADVLAKEAEAIRKLGDGGWLPDTVVEAVTSRDLRRLRHSGYLPVQVQPIRGDQPPEGPAGGAFIQIPEFASVPAISPLPRLVGEWTAATDFWPASGPLVEFGPVSRGTLLEAPSPYLRAFPSLFEPAGSDLAERARRLRDGGLSVAAIAARVDRTERHVRRLLNAGA